MTQQEKRIKIAEACGWTAIENYFNNDFEHPNDYRWEIRGRSIDGTFEEIPDYFNSLDAMQEAKTFLSASHKASYASLLYLGRDCLFQDYCNNALIFKVLSVTAAQCAEAFGLAMNLW